MLVNKYMFVVVVPKKMSEIK